MNRDTLIFMGIGVGVLVGVVGIEQYNAVKERQLREKKAENERLYFAKLSPEQVENIEKKKLEVEQERIKLKQTEDELKKTVADFKNQVQSEIETKVMTDIHDNMRNTFDTWSSKFEVRLENKVDNVVNRIDNLSDKYGGVKTNNSTPSINVVNAPNN